MLEPAKDEIRKPTKTISGITPVAVMLPPRKCKHGSCIYCPSMNVPQSYTPKSPVVLRAKALDYDSYKQVVSRIAAFGAMNHPTEKVELIIMGGTFLEYPKKFQYDFVKGLYDGLNGNISKNLKEAKKENEKAKHRCVALCIETRPDVCCEFIERMREFGCTRVELGVQLIDNKVYKFVKRGHTVNDVVLATKCLRNAGFKIGYHLMPGLPGSNPEKDLRLFKKIFSDEKFKPDQIKIYPCQVLPCSELEKLYWTKKYKPYTPEQIQKLLVEMLKVIPRYCRVMRIMREIPLEYLVAGSKHIGIRKDVEDELRKKNVKLKEIRYREVGFNKEDINLDMKLKITKYKASGGNEYFIEIINKEDILFGLLRLRVFEGKDNSPAHPPLGKDVINDKTNSKLGSTINRNIDKFDNLNSKKNKIAIIRELHVYGQSLNLGEEGKFGQHTGLGKWLMGEGENIVKKEKCKEIKVISGVGVREYYRKLRYELDEGKGEYMRKLL
jgi:elongator complex protein 3